MNIFCFPCIWLLYILALFVRVGAKILTSGSPLIREDRRESRDYLEWQNMVWAICRTVSKNISLMGILLWSFPLELDSQILVPKASLFLGISLPNSQLLWDINILMGIHL